LMKMTNYWMGLQSCLNSKMIEVRLLILLADEPCKLNHRKRFYKEHDYLIREFPSF